MEKAQQKQTKVFLLVNTLTSISSFIYNNHIGHAVWHAKNRPDIQLYYNTPHRTSIDHARNAAAKLALEYECDYLLFLDDDVIVPKDSLARLIDADKDIVAGNVIIRGYPFNQMAFRFGKRSKQRRNLGYFNDLPKTADGKVHKLVKCDAVGFSLCLIKTEIFKKIEPPWFVTGIGNTEDVYFCLKAKEALGKKLSLFMDTTIECGHLMNPEPVFYSNREDLRAFYKTMLESVEEQGRGQEYIRRNLLNVKM